MPIALALLASLAWGAADFLGGMTSRKEHYLSVTFWRVALEVAVVGAVLLVVPGTFHWSDMGWGGLAGLSTTVTVPLFYAALSRGRMGVVAPITGTIAAAVPLVVGLLQGERPSTVQLVGACLAIGAVLLVSLQSHGPTESPADDPTLGETAEHPDGRTVAPSSIVGLWALDVRLAVLCGLGFGAYFSLLHNTHDDSGLWPSMAVVSVMFVAIPVIARFSGVSLRLGRESWAINSVGGLLEAGANVSYLYATRAGLLSVVGVLSSLFPVVTAVLAWIVLREHVSKLHAAGLGVALVSLLLLSAG